MKNLISYSLMLFIILCCLLSCGEETNHKSSHQVEEPTDSKAKIKSLLTKYLDRRQDSATITENALLRHLIVDDTTGLIERLEYETRGYNNVEIGPELNELFADNEVRSAKSGTKNIFKVSVSYSLSSSVVQATISEDIKSGDYQLKFVHYIFDVKNNVGIVDTVFTNKTIPVKKEEWDKLNELVDVSLFWRTARFANEDGFTDGSGWTLEGLRRFRSGETQYHSLSIDNPEESVFRDACEYLMELSGEDLSWYRHY